MRLKKLLRNALNSWNRYQYARNWHKKDPPFPIDPSLSKKLIHLGFYPSDSIIYDFEKYGYDAFLNQREYKNLKYLNGATSPLIDNKAFLPIILHGLPEYLPDFFAFVSNGRVRFSRGTYFPYGELEAFLKAAIGRFGQIIIKPSSEYGGKNILIVHPENLKEGLNKLKKGDHVINNILENEDFIAAINPQSLNTFRVVFFKDRSGKNQILMMAHRFGSSLSNHVDNISRGGMACAMDLRTGRFSKGCSYVHPSYLGWFEKHIETGVQIEGQIIPEWTEKKAIIQKIVNQLDFIDFAGIDLAFTKSGIKVIEINSKPQAQLMQVSGPALLNSDFKDFIFSKGYRPKHL